ncbi:MAG: hypothetical protein SGI84_08685 [Gemmatimonadota bacterium]|nr:hypothetical protein [Gemmatimonadota bacterium]
MNAWFASVAMVTALLGASVPEAASPNLSGTWTLQVAQSDFGQLPGPESRTDVIDHQEPRLAIKRTTTAQGNTTVADMSYVVDGQAHKNVAGPTELSSVLSWDGEVLVMVSTANSPQGALTITDRYTLSADGRALAQARTLSIQGQELAQRLVLTRP